MSIVDRFAASVLASIVAGAAIGPAAVGQGCIDGQPIRPTYSASGPREWGQEGVAVAGSDVFLATGPYNDTGTVAVMRLSGTAGVSQVQQISTGKISCLRAAGDMFFVGSDSTANGRVRIYRRQSSGTYALAATLSGSMVDEGFGTRLAVNEDATVLVVGAPFAGSAPNADAGKAYVYSRNVSTGAWSLQSTLQSPSGPVFNVRFGNSVAASGNRVAVIEGGTASARIFVRSGSSWALEASVTNSMGSSSANYDRHSFLSGDLLWIHNTEFSRFDVFERSGTAWPLRQTLALSNVRAVGFSNGILCTSQEVGTFSSTPRIMVQAFRRSGSQNQWSNFATVQTPALDENSTNHLAMSGDLVVVDAYWLDFGSVMDHGAAFLFDIDFTDCNGNGVRDECDIASGTATDANANGIPDSCENRCVSDLNGDGFVDGTDLGRLLNDWGACPN